MPTPGKTVIVTTHILEVAERLADRIGIIAGGKLYAEGTLAELRAHAGSDDATLEDAFIRLTQPAEPSRPDARLGDAPFAAGVVRLAARA